MKSKKIKVVFTAPDIEMAETLICDVFFEAGLRGVICETPMEKKDIASTDLWDEDVKFSSDETAIVGYLPDISSTKGLIDLIGRKLNTLDCLDIRTRIVMETVDDEDWAHAWKSHFHVTRITDRIVVRPSWKSFDPAPSDLVIDLDPGMAFGTGTHPTTVMCIQLIEQFLHPKQRILDVGTGSGILLAAAWLLGARHLTGIDIDPMAVTVSNENLLKNHVDPSCFQLFCTPISDLVPEENCFDLVVANILAHMLVDLMDDLKKRTRSGGVVILSGIVRERLPDVEIAMEKAGMQAIEMKFTDEWVAVATQVPESALDSNRISERVSI